MNARTFLDAITTGLVSLAFLVAWFLFWLVVFWSFIAFLSPAA